ncbi:MAG: cytochrome c3 family protein [bacterium]|nr:cytochrome c3 family protein [bacterium]
MKKWLLAFLLIIFLNFNVKASIIETVHNQELNAQFSGGGDFEGVCAYCHVPHSSKGPVLWRYEMESKEFGKIGNLCYSCHGTNRAGTKANKSFTVFNLQKDNHPVVNASNIEPNVDETDWLNNRFLASTWPHAADTTDIECSTCHNPHDNRFGRFLNALLFDTSADEGGYNYENTLQNFCSYCHQKRESSLKGKENKGTHPVGANITNENLPGVFIDSAIFAKPFGVLGGHLAYGTTGGVTCVTCHSPHGVPASKDGLYADGTPLRVGPLLVINNDTTKSQPDSTDIPTGGGGQSLLCEACHGKTPFMKDTAYFSHPLDRYPPGTRSDDNISSSGDTLAINYPPVSWINYEESGEPNTHQGKGARGLGEYLVCMSCHDPHGAKPGTPLLRKGSSDNFCEDCHNSAPVAGENHPVDTVGISIWQDGTKISTGSFRSRNRDGFEMAIRESLEIYDSPGIFITDIQNALRLKDGYITCRTCHSPHSAMNSRLLTITDRNSEICECCHTYPDEPHNPSVYYFEGPGEVYPDGKANEWMPVKQGKVNKEETYELPRLGSHYIGSVVPEDRPLYDTFYVAYYDTGYRTDWLATAHVDNGYNSSWPGSNQFSHLGGPGADPKRSGNGGTMIICQSCHTPHGAAKGLAVDGGEKLGRLLLTPNTESQLCSTCHNPEGSHPVLNKIVSRTNQPLNPRDSKFAVGYYNSLYLKGFTMPADYPDTANNNNPIMVCESCHAAHNAYSLGGAFIMEAGGDSTSVSAPGGIGWFNKKTPSRDHQPLCNRCHLQGIVDGK